MSTYCTAVVFIFFFVLSLFGMFAHLYAVGHQDLFGDEVHSLFFFRSHSWLDLLRQPVEPIHPNGYYVLLKAWYTITPSVTALRWWQFGIFLMSCAAIWLVCRQLRFNRSVAMMTLALWASSAYVWHFSFQLRMYGIGMTLILLSLWALLARRPWFSVVLDGLALSFTYGAALFIAVKWAAWMLLRWREQKKPITLAQYVQTFLPAGAGLLPLLLIGQLFFQQQATINSAFLYWVHRPVLADFSLALGSFFTGLFLPYFESASDLSSPWLRLGLLANGVIIIVMLSAGAVLWRQRRAIKTWWQHCADTDRLFLLTAAGVGGGYTLLFLHGWLTGNHLFHIRQLFPVAVIGWLSVGWSVNHLWKLPLSRRASSLLRGMMMSILTLVCALNLVAIAADSWGGRQTYTHHFTQLPGTPLFASSSDVELIYKQCHDFNRTTAVQSCAQRQIYIDALEASTTGDNPSFWLTTRAYEAYRHSIVDNRARCHQSPIDFWECEQ